MYGRIRIRIRRAALLMIPLVIHLVGFFLESFFSPSISVGRRVTDRDHSVYLLSIVKAAEQTRSRRKLQVTRTTAKTLQAVMNHPKGKLDSYTIRNVSPDVCSS